MPSTAYTRTAVAAVAVGVALALAPHDDAPARSSWGVTDLSASQQQASHRVAAAGAARSASGVSGSGASGTRRSGRSSERATGSNRRAGARHPWWPKGYCQAVRHRRWPVRSGDTLDLVARCTGATVADLRAANGLGGSAGLRPGRELVIPH